MLTIDVFLQMAYNTRSGSSREPPPPPPPPPTLEALMQSLVENQRLMAHAIHRLAQQNEQGHQRQGPQPNQYASYKDFLDVKPPIFKEAEEPL